MRFLEPNKPIRTSEEFLNDIDSSYVADSKLDGWRIEIGKTDGKLHYISRINKQLDIPNNLKEYFDKHLPEGMAIDAEWVNKTRLKAVNTNHNVNLPILDCIVLFDIKWMNNKLIYDKTLSERREIDFYKNLPIIDLDNIEDGAIYQINSVSGDKAKEFYDIQKTYPLSEGLVIKKKAGNLENRWYKVKYRE